MEFDLDEYLHAPDTSAAAKSTSSGEPSNALEAIARQALAAEVATAVAATAVAPEKGLSRRARRRRRRLMESPSAGPFTGMHSDDARPVLPPEWNLSPRQYRWHARRENSASDRLRDDLPFISSFIVGGSGTFWAAWAEPGVLAGTPDFVLAVMGVAGLWTTLGGLFWLPSTIHETREAKQYNPSVLAHLDPALGISLNRLPYEVESLIESIASSTDNGADSGADTVESGPVDTERHRRLATAYRLSSAMVATLEAHPDCLPERTSKWERGAVDLPVLYRLCPDALRELVEFGVSLDHDHIVSEAGSIHARLVALDRQGNGPASTTPPLTSMAGPSGLSSAPTAVETLDERWAAALALHDEVVEAWTAIVTDPLAALEHSLLLDVTQPRTAAFIEAYGHAQDLRAVHGTHLPDDSTLQVAYFAAVRKADEAWTEAVRYAKHVRLSWLPEREAALVRKATGLLASAGDDAQPLHVRAEAAAKASHLLSKVTSFLLPPMAMHALEASRRLALPASPQR